MDAYKQLSFFKDEFEERNCKDIGISNESDEMKAISQRVYNLFGEMEFKYAIILKWIDSIYKSLEDLVPKEKIEFNEIEEKIAIQCELVCVSICNGINWDYLRKAIYAKVLENPNWVSLNHLISIKEDEIYELFMDYPKKEKINPAERCKLIKNLASTYKNNGFNEIFYNSKGEPQDYFSIRKKLLECEVFSQDAVEKKLQLFLMRLSFYNGFEKIKNKCQPTVDYHIIRSFTRRGFLIIKNDMAKEFIVGKSVHNENTIAAIRQHCANIIKKIGETVNLSILDLNQIEWWFGRSICKENTPDCFLNLPTSNWLKNVYEKCPFFEYCLASQNDRYIQLTLEGYDNNEDDGTINLKELNSPNYEGNSF